MAAQRTLTEQFPFEDEVIRLQLRLLMRALEARFTGLERERATFEEEVRKFETIGFELINQAIVPSMTRITAMVEHGFLIAHAHNPLTLAVGASSTFVVDDELERSLFTPSTFVTISRTTNADDYAVGRVTAWDPPSGTLIVSLIDVVGEPGPHTDWEIASAPGTALAAFQARATAVEVSENLSTTIASVESTSLALAVALS